MDCEQSIVILILLIETLSHLSGNFTGVFNDVDATRQLQDLGNETLRVLQGKVAIVAEEFQRFATIRTGTSINDCVQR